MSANLWKKPTEPFHLSVLLHTKIYKPIEWTIAFWNDKTELNNTHWRNRNTNIKTIHDCRRGKEMEREGERESVGETVKCHKRQTVLIQIFNAFQQWKIISWMNRIPCVRALCIEWNVAPVWIIGLFILPVRIQCSRLLSEALLNSV